MWSFTDSGRSRRSRRALAALALAAGVVGLMAFRSRVEPEALRTSAVRSAGPAPLAHAMTKKQPTVPVAPIGAPQASRPVIDAVEVAATEVCRGEQNLVRVRAHTVDDSDPYLRISMSDPRTGKLLQGSSIPFRLERPPEHDIKIFVEGRRTTAEAKLPPIRVKDCDGPRHATIHYERRFEKPDRVTFSASFADEPGARPSAEAGGESTEDATGDGGSTRAVPSPAPVAYEWDFGDGERLTTSEPRIEHSYEAREQRGVVSTYLVSVTVKDAEDRVAHDMVSIPLTNLGFVPLVHERTVTIFAGMNPAESAGADEELWLYHGYPESIRIDSAKVSETVVGSDGAEHETWSENHSPEEFLGFSTLPPRQSPRVRSLAWLRPRAEGAIRVVEIRGRSADGLEAHGRFTPPDAAEPP
jgi:hypothetical protein